MLALLNRSQISEPPNPRPLDRPIIASIRDLLKLKCTVEHLEVRWMHLADERSSRARHKTGPPSAPLRCQGIPVDADGIHTPEFRLHPRNLRSTLLLKAEEVSKGKRQQQVPGTVFCDLPADRALDEHALMLGRGEMYHQPWNDDGRRHPVRMPTAESRDLLGSALEDQLTNAGGVSLSTHRLHDRTDDGTGSLNLAVLDLLQHVGLCRKRLVNRGDERAIV